MAKTNSLNHVAIIMDGNGRWADKKGLPKLEGHKAGAKALKDIIPEIINLNINYITVYAFSTENWKRSPKEVYGLMSLLNEFVDENLDSMQEQGVRLRTIGEFNKLPPNNRAKLNKAMSLTKENKACTLTLALSYGGRKEIVDAVKNIAEDLKGAKIKSSQITEKTIAKYLYAPDIPDPDLMIRTSGEKRISNFLLWQLSYSEFYFTETLWPDFNAEELNKAVDYYYKRERRFGGR